MKLRAMSLQAEINTFYGPVEGITGVCALHTSNEVLCCSADKSIRLFDLNEFSQLIFQGASELSACCCMSGDIFLSCGAGI